MSFEASKKKLQKSKKIISQAEDNMNAVRDELRYKIGKLAEDCSLLDLDISEKEMRKEFMEIFSKYQTITKQKA